MFALRRAVLSYLKDKGCLTLRKLHVKRRDELFKVC